MNRLLLTGAATIVAATLSTGIAPSAHTDPHAADPIDDSAKATCTALRDVTGTGGENEMERAVNVDYTIQMYYRLPTADESTVVMTHQVKEDCPEITEYLQFASKYTSANHFPPGKKVVLDSSWLGYMNASPCSVAVQAQPRECTAGGWDSGGERCSGIQPPIPPACRGQEGY